MWVFATSDPVTPIHVILGQREDTTLALARANATFAALDLAGLPSPEWVPLYRVILRNDATPYEETSDLRTQVAMPAGAYTPAQHSALAGRSAADSHPASAIGVDASGFGGNLSGTDTDVQTALDTIDAMPVGGGGTLPGLTDGPAGYGNAGDVVATNATVDGWEWVAPGGGSGDVVGPAGATDGAIALFDTATGKLLKDSGVTLADLGAATPANTQDGTLLYGSSAAWAEGFPMVNSEGLILTNAQGLIVFGGM
jgi:hypothetical protein